MFPLLLGVVQSIKCTGQDFFNLSEGIPVQMSQLSAAAAGAEGAHLETG